jgi:hypothetical protein
MTDKEIINLLRSGNFTIYYHDNGQCMLFNGKHSEVTLPEKEDASFDLSGGDGYAPEIVCLLVAALHGCVESA